MKNIVFDIPKGFEIDKNKSTKDKIILKYREKTFVNLGLPSGNLWASENEDEYYTYEDAVKQFGENLPTIVDYAELIHYCKWEWDKKLKAMIVTGSNNNYIVLKTEGCRRYDGSGALSDVGDSGYYWSASPYPSNSNYAYYLNFYCGNVHPARSIYRGNGYSVHCVKRIK